jgi:hypothetical protein
LKSKSKSLKNDLNRDLNQISVHEISVFAKIKKNIHIGKIAPPIGGAANEIACISRKIGIKQQKPKYYQGLPNPRITA